MSPFGGFNRAALCSVVMCRGSSCSGTEGQPDKSFNQDIDRRSVHRPEVLVTFVIKRALVRVWKRAVDREQECEEQKIERTF